MRTSGRYPGYRGYQLEDHLGNVRVVVGDNKAADTSSGGLYLASRVLSASEYFPFGLTARSYAPQSYRWSYNGKEKDAALGSNDAQDYGFRAYRPEIARFMSVDPLREKYPELTTYQFAGNTPIEAVDLDGLEPASYKMQGSGKPPEVVMPSDHNQQRLGDGYKPIPTGGTPSNATLSVEAKVSYGAQVGIEVGKFGAKVNAGSKTFVSKKVSVSYSGNSNSSQSFSVEASPTVTPSQGYNGPTQQGAEVQYGAGRLSINSDVSKSTAEPSYANFGGVQMSRAPIVTTTKKVEGALTFFNLGVKTGYSESETYEGGLLTDKTKNKLGSEPNFQYGRDPLAKFGVSAIIGIEIEIGL